MGSTFTRNPVAVYSYRSASTGLTRAARCAGTKHAAKPARLSVTTTVAKMTVSSHGLTLNRIACRPCASSPARPSPRTRPMASCRAPQEAARVLAEAIDYSRQGQVAAINWGEGGE